MERISEVSGNGAGSHSGARTRGGIRTRGGVRKRGGVDLGLGSARGASAVRGRPALRGRHAARGMRSATAARRESGMSHSELYVECGGGGTSTPRTAGGSAQYQASTHRASGCTRSLIPRLPPRDDEITQYLDIGSEESEEEDGQEEDGQEEGLPPMHITKSLRMLLGDTEEVGNASVELNYSWPPSSLQPSSRVSDQGADPTPAPLSPAPESQPAGSAMPTNDTGFNFQWRAFPKLQIEPERRRETFSASHCGPTLSYASAYEVFTSIWDREIMERIVEETNRYAQHYAEIKFRSGDLGPNSRITNWYDTTVDELYVFFAIIQATGIVVKTRMDEYWNCSKDIFSTPEFSTAMRFDRFVLLSRCLHFRNNAKCNITTMSRAQAKLFKIQPVLDHLNLKFAQLYDLDQNVALDESLTMWKGRLEINQFIKNKAAAVGIKTYEVCESKSGYLWRFEIHAGQEESTDDNPVSGVVPSIVLRLLNGLEHKGHCIWMDNFYNSPALARELKCRGFDCVGTLRTNRQFVPVELMALTKQNMAVGQVCGCTSGDVDLLVWRDKNCVALISTYHGLATTKCDETLKPTVIHDYNICMGGVDRKDQMLAMFPLERKRTQVWYKKFFRRLLNASILNAYIIFKSQHSTNHRSFRKTLVSELLSRHTTSQPGPSAVTLSATHNTTQGFVHYPKQYVVTENASKANRYRRNCAECGKRVTAYCNGCNAPLCVFTCFEPYHTKLIRNTAQ